MPENKNPVIINSPVYIGDIETIVAFCLNKLTQQNPYSDGILLCNSHTGLKIKLSLRCHIV